MIAQLDSTTMLSIATVPSAGLSSSASTASSSSFVSLPTLSAGRHSRCTVRLRAGSLTVVAAAAVAASAYDSMSLGQLRALAKQRGVRGDTRAELIKLLGRSPAAPSPSPSSSSSSFSAPAAFPPSPSPSPSPSQDRRSLESLPLGQLRAMARMKGVQGLAGATKAELVKALLVTNGAATAPPPATSSFGSSFAPSSPSAFPSPPPSPSTLPSSLESQLSAQPLSALRAMARQKGLQGNTKAELVAALIKAQDQPIRPPSSSPSSPPTTSWTSTPSPPTSASPSSTSSPPPSLSSLQNRPLSELRQMARQRGIRADTKTELLQLLAEKPTPTTFSIPFQSDVATTVPAALQTFQSSTTQQLSAEVASLREAIEQLQSTGTSLREERDSLADQSSFLRNVLVGGLGLALVPLLLPFQIGTSTNTSTTGTIAPAVDPTPEVRELSPEDFCASMPTAFLSPQAAAFCSNILDMAQ